MNIKKILAVSAVGLLLAGCKISITVPEGGTVTTESGNHTCEAGETCEVSVTDIFFDETFVATPHEGMKFTGWEKRNRGFCGGNMDACRLFTSGFEGNDTFMSFLDDDTQTFYLNPTFAEDDGVGAATACEFEQSTPGGDFDVCVVADDITEASCASIAAATFGGESMVTGRDCAGDNPTGYCATDVGDIYYYVDADLSVGCGFMGGEWVEL